MTRISCGSGNEGTQIDESGPIAGCTRPEVCMGMDSDMDSEPVGHSRISKRDSHRHNCVS